MSIRNFSLIAATVLVLFGSGSAQSAPRPSIAIRGAPQLPANFTAFPYVNPAAPKGGTLRLGVIGSFENLNPLIVAGVPASAVREFTVESLMARSYDEPFTLYPLLAQSIDTPPDRSSVTFQLNPRARFSDGTPVTVEDVVYSLQTLRDKGRPNYKKYYEKVLRIF